ncbi:MAG TPA: MFS transporter, partial [Pseudomonas sp.]|nr:MFS transporter [Pseudomonas sp.]
MRVSFEKAPLARLFLAQALYWSCAIMGVILNAVAGLELAGTATLATLPLGLMALGYLASVQPLARLMQRRGRRLGFMLGSLAGIGAGLAAALALQLSSF